MIHRRDFLKFIGAGVIINCVGVLPSVTTPVFQKSKRQVIKIIGVGNAGCNIIDHMIKSKHLLDMEFIAINTDARSLAHSLAMRKIQIGSDITCGLGTGGNHEAGREAVCKARNRIVREIEDADRVVIIAGMGGGTGTGASPVVASTSKALGILTIAIITKPFAYEGRRRKTSAEEGIRRLSEYADTMIVIPNDKLSYNVDESTTLIGSFSKVNDVLRQTIQSIYETILFTRAY